MPETSPENIQQKQTTACLRCFYHYPAITTLKYLGLTDAGISSPRKLVRTTNSTMITTVSPGWFQA
jgi:hypothetical protein